MRRERCKVGGYFILDACRVPVWGGGSAGLGSSWGSGVGVIIINNVYAL